MYVFAFVLSCIIARTTHGRRSERLSESPLKGHEYSKVSGHEKIGSSSLQGVSLEAQHGTSYWLKALANSLLALHPGAALRPHANTYPYAASNGRRQFPDMIFGNFAKPKSSSKSVRPKEGDAVMIKSTPTTRKYCPHLIGTRSTIVVDTGDEQPYQVESDRWWFTAEDLEVAEEQNTLLDKLHSNEVIKLRNSEEFQEKVEEAARENKALVVGFFASWCRACKATKPKFMKITERWPEVEFCQILFDDNKELARSKGIKSLPYFEIYTGDKEKVDGFQCGPSKIQMLDETLKERMNDFSAR